jgi:hypothetical protein
VCYFIVAHVKRFLLLCHILLGVVGLQTTLCYVIVVEKNVFDTLMVSYVVVVSKNVICVTLLYVAIVLLLKACRKYLNLARNVQNLGAVSVDITTKSSTVFVSIVSSEFTARAPIENGWLLTEFVVIVFRFFEEESVGIGKILGLKMNAVNTYTIKLEQLLSQKQETSIYYDITRVKCRFILYDLVDW